MHSIIIITMATNWQPPAADQNSPISPTITEFRKRSLPPHIIETQKKEALAMVTKKETPPEDAQSQQARSSFFVRYFYRPIQREDGDDSETTPGQRFSLLSRGFIVLAALLCLIIIAILCAVLGTIYSRHHRQAKAIRFSPVHEAIFANFPDPCLVKHEGTFYALATTNAAGQASPYHLVEEHED